MASIIAMASPPPPAMTRRVRAFNRWMRSHGVDASDALEIADPSPSDGTGGVGVHVRARCDLHDGELVASIPKSACLTVRTSGSGEALEEAELGGALALAVALMYERSLGSESPWHGYLQLLPERELVPLVWNLEEVDDLLVGTELHKVVKDDKSLLYEDWKEFIKPLIHSELSGVDPDAFSVEQYFSAKSLVTSRSFQVDDYHGHGMVPLADLFNHKTGAEDVHFTSACSCGSDNDGDGVISDSSNGDQPSSDDPHMLEMIIVKDVKAGDEVFNTYGSMSNAALLHRYGFTEANNPYDIVNIDMSLVQKWWSCSFSDRHGRARLSLWRRLNYSGCISQSSEYFEISSDGEPQLELLVLLYIIILPDDAYGELDSMIDSFEGSDETASIIKLASLTENKCQQTPEDIKELLLREIVCDALLAIADMRESLYGPSSLKEDEEKLSRCCPMKERKLYHSLMLRVSERIILTKLRTYASRWFKAKRRKL